MHPGFQSALGLLVFTLLAWLASERRRAVRWRLPVAGIAIQLSLAWVLLELPPVQTIFGEVNDAVLGLQRATEAGTAFVFGYLAGGPLPFEETQPGASFVLALRALPLVIVVSALTALLVYWRILPIVVKAFSMLLERTLGVGGAVGLATAANVFVGMVEAPLFVRPYLRALTRGELFVLMTAGMATIAGTVLVLYASVLAEAIPGAASHLLVASLISAPAAIVVAKLMVPDDAPSTAARLDPERGARGAMDALTRGTQSGVELYIQITAMLLVVVALVHLVNALLGLLPDVLGEPISLERALGAVMAPVVWLMGVPWAEAPTAGELMGVKTVLNELLAYLQLAGLPPDALSERSRVIMTYALCGFANFGSLGIMVAGIGTLVPERRAEVLALGMKSIVAGTLATCCTGAVIGILY